MKLVSYLKDDQDQLGILVDGIVYDTDTLHPDLPASMSLFLNFWDDSIQMAQAGMGFLKSGRFSKERGTPLEQLQLLAPVPYPTSCRQVQVLPEPGPYPVLYFTNHHRIGGAGAVAFMPDHLEALDVEPEVAIVISKHGRNIRAEEAGDYVGGLMLLNGFKARHMPGAIVASATGPWLVTPDELEEFAIPAKEGHIGKTWNLPVTGTVNGVQISSGNLGAMAWTFAEMIACASYGADLYPGDIISSGMVATGSFGERNNTGKGADAAYTAAWLQADDVLELSVEGLGVLRNTIVAEATDWSILNGRNAS